MYFSSFLSRAVVCAFVSVIAVSAQESVSSSSVSGRVIDPSGAAVQGAQINARETATNVATSVTSDKEGRFRLPYCGLVTMR